MPDFALTSTAFDPGGAIPSRFTCDGEDVSPDLAWSGAPDGTTALTLVVDDPDARGWVHWIVLDMAGTATGGLPHGVGVLARRARPGPQRLRAGWLGRPVPAVGHAPLRIHAVRDRGPARAARPARRRRGPEGARQGRRPGQGRARRHLPPRRLIRRSPTAARRGARGFARRDDPRVHRIRAVRTRPPRQRGFGRERARERASVHPRVNGARLGGHATPSDRETALAAHGVEPGALASDRRRVPCRNAAPGPRGRPADRARRRSPPRILPAGRCGPPRRRTGCRR